MIQMIIYFAIILLFFAGLYLIIKLAVKNALRELLQELAERLWKEDEDGEQ